MIQITNYNQFLELMLHQYEDSENLKGIISGVLENANDVETALFEIQTEFYLSNAVGAQLDIIGAVFNVERSGLFDALYRQAIQERAVLRYSGEPESIIDMMQSIFGATWVRYRLCTTPGKYYIYTDATGILAEVLNPISPSGVQGLFEKPIVVGENDIPALWYYGRKSILTYPLESDALDISGNGNNGTATDITWTGGVANFNGTSSKIVSSLSIPNLTGYSISFRFKRNGVPSVFERIFSNYKDGNNYTEIYFSTSTGKLTFLNRVSGVQSTGATLNNLCDNIEHHIVLNILNSTQFQFTVDGVTESVLTISTALTSFVSPSLNIGFQNTSLFFTGTMSNFYIFNRALTTAEIADIYNEETFPIENKSNFVDAYGRLICSTIEIERLYFVDAMGTPIVDGMNRNITTIKFA